MNELVIAAIPVGAAVAGWAVNKQLNINRQVASLATKVESMEETINHTRTRVDAIYDHLIEKGQRDRS